MAKVVKHNQQTFNNYNFYHSIGLGNINVYCTTKSKLGSLKASRRTGIFQQNKRNPVGWKHTNDQFRLESSSPQPQTPLTKTKHPLVLSEHLQDSDLTDYKRHKPEDLNCNEINLTNKTRVTFCCLPSSMDKDHFQSLLAKEFHYHPNNAFLYYVNPQADDKVDVVLRNEAVHNLRFLHNAFLNLSTEIFCKAVNLVDRFIVKVKVKPKYITCVATAAYCLAYKLTGFTTDRNTSLPDLDTMVQITRCGGNSADLLRMEEILTSKLLNDLNGVNAFDFLNLFLTTLKCENQVEAENVSNLSNDEKKIDTILNSSNKLHLLAKRFGTLMEIALCSLEVYQFRPACLALGIMFHAEICGLEALANLCDIDWLDVCDCAKLINQLYKLYYRNPLPRTTCFNHTGLQLNYVYPNGSIKSKNKFRIGYSSPTPLDTISEDYEPADEDEWFLSFLFES